MIPRFKHALYDYHFVVTFILLAVAFILWACIPSIQTWSFLSTSIAAIFGLLYFALKQHLDETRLFKELFSEFNGRYDKLNKALYAIRNAPENQPLTTEEIMSLYDYFNLCAEEYLYYRKGFIYPEVWLAWHNGMKIFCQYSRIRKLWEEELQTNSYYGFSLPCSKQET